MTESRWRVGAVDDRHRAEVQDLFVRCFGHPISDALWDWKYADGRGTHTGAWVDDELVAHYGGLSRRIWLFGRPAMAFQGCDVMVAPQERGRLARENPLSLVTRGAIQAQVGTGRPHDLLYGFPNLRHMRAAERRGLYETVGRVHEWRAPVNPRSVPGWQFSPCALETVKDRWAVRYLAMRMRRSLRSHVALIKDLAYLQDRYLTHPNAQAYRMFIVRRSGWPVALLVLKDEGANWRVMDYVGPLARLPDVLTQLSHFVDRACHMWVLDDWRALCQAVPGEWVDLEIPIAAQLVTDGVPASALAGRWWLTAGDTDFL